MFVKKQLGVGETTELTTRLTFVKKQLGVGETTELTTHLTFVVLNNI